MHPSSGSVIVASTLSSSNDVTTNPPDDVSVSQPTRLEMPFASVPESISSPATDSSSSPVRSVTLPAPLPQPKEETTDEEEAAITTSASTTTANTSSASQSPREETVERSKSPAESSEVDLDSLSGQHKTESVDIESGETSTTAATTTPVSTVSRVRGGASTSGLKRKAPSVTPDVGSRSPMHGGKRKRRTREAVTRGGRGGRGRPGSDRLVNEDFDDDDHHHKNVVNLPSLGNLDNDALMALTQRSPNSKKYNFFVDLGEIFNLFFEIVRIGLF